MPLSPVDVCIIGSGAGGAPMALQLGWAVVLLGAAQLATMLATRRVVIQGG